MGEALCMLVNLASSALSRSLSSFSCRSHPNFDDRTVGLGILLHGESPPPLPLFSTSPAISNTPNWKRQQQQEESDEEEEYGDDDEMEMNDEIMSESYAWLESYVEGIRTIYLDQGGDSSSSTASFDASMSSPISSSSSSNSWSNSAVFFVGSPPPSLLPLAADQDFMAICLLCDKSLHNQDIFMFRGEKCFCSPECRYEYVFNDTEICPLEKLDLLKCLLPCSTAAAAPRPLGMP